MVKHGLRSFPDCSVRRVGIHQFLFFTFFCFLGKFHIIIINYNQPAWNSGQFMATGILEGAFDGTARILAFFSKTKKKKKNHLSIFRTV